MANDMSWIVPGIFPSAPILGNRGLVAGISGSRRLSIQACPVLLLPRSRLLSILDAGAGRDALDPEILRQIFSDVGPTAAGDAARLLFRDVAGGQALLRQLVADYRPPRRLVAISRPLVLPSRAAPWSPPQALAQDAEPGLPDRSRLEMATSKLEEDIAPADEASPADRPRSLPAFPTIEPSRPPIPSKTRSRIFAHAMPRVGGSRIGKRGKLVAGALAASIAVLLVLPSRPHVHPPRAMIAASEPAPSLTRGASPSPLLATREIEPRAQTIVTREPPRNPLDVVTAPPLPKHEAAPIMRAVAALVPQRVLPPPAAAQALLVVPAPAQTIVTRDKVSPGRPRAARKKASKIAAAASRKRPDVVSLVLPDVLKPQ